jgi:hypothetical protein
MGLEWEKTIYQLVQDFFHRTTILETSGNTGNGIFLVVASGINHWKSLEILLNEIMTTPPNSTEQDARRAPMYHV